MTFTMTYGILRLAYAGQCASDPLGTANRVGFIKTLLGLSWEQAEYIAERMNDYGVPHSEEIILP